MAVVVSALRDIQPKFGDAVLEGFLMQLAQWHHNEWLHLNPGAILSCRLQRYQASLETEALPEIFVAYNGTTLLGSVTLDKEDMDTRSHLTPWLASLYVQPDNRRQGVASQLIKYVVCYAKENGYKNIYLFTEDQTDFYQHRGWHFIESVEYRNAEVDLMFQNLK